MTAQELALALSVFLASAVEMVEALTIVLAVGLTLAAAAVALLIVLGAGLLVRAPLARVPENQMKYGVGVLLTAIGVFWLAEGAGLHWPGGEASLGVLIPAVLVASLAGVQPLRRRSGLQG